MKLIDEVVDVGVCVEYVSGLQGQKVLLGGLAKSFFQGADVVHELHRFVVANIINTPRS